MEVMVSMTVLGVVLVGLGQGLTLGIRMNIESKARMASLSVAKRVVERVKSEIQYSQADFDGANDNDEFNRTFFVDPDGNDIVEAQDEQTPGASGVAGDTGYPSGGTGTETAKMPTEASYRVMISVEDWADAEGNKLTVVDSDGVEHVMVKVLTVRVRSRQSAVLSNAETRAASRDVVLDVEMVRPAA
jgi:type II secretory pathway pseudopilin PulG